MKIADVSRCKNLWDRVSEGSRRGEAPDLEGAPVTPPRHTLRVTEFLARPRPTLRPGASLVEAVLEEREEWW